MSLFRKAADVFHKTAVTGLMGLTVLGVVNIVTSVSDVEISPSDSAAPAETKYQEFLKEKIAEEARKIDDPNAVIKGDSDNK
mmetsp:Transcript_44384/g.53651  ORF Transcript_44384/g.53651 Transcript_44384/m.53651 type:complete len:82 (-) Transcript_44384:11-256(-)